MKALHTESIGIDLELGDGYAALASDNFNGAVQIFTDILHKARQFPKKRIPGQTYTRRQLVAIAHTSLSMAYLNLSRPSSALRSARAAIAILSADKELRSCSTAAHVDILGNDITITLKRSWVQAQVNEGVALQAKSHFARALKAYRKAKQLMISTDNLKMMSAVKYNMTTTELELESSLFGRLRRIVKELT